MCVWETLKCHIRAPPELGRWLCDSIPVLSNGAPRIPKTGLMTVLLLWSRQGPGSTPNLALPL